MSTTEQARQMALVGLGFLLVSCSKAPEPARTVTYYREHADERKAMVELCADDPGTRAQDPDCVNAQQATAIEDIGSFRDLEPLGLLPPKKDAGKSGGAPPASD